MKLTTKTSHYLSYYKAEKWAKRHLTDDFSSEELMTYKKHIWKNKLNKAETKIYFKEINKEASKKRKKYWDNYLEKILPKKQKNIELEISTTPTLTAIIIEARKHPHFKVVVENMISNLQHLNVGLTVYHGNENDFFLKECLQEHKNINFINLNVDNLNIEDYNKVMLSKKFHEIIKTDKFLVFQTDTITFKPLDKKFLKYDYIGAPWKKELHSDYGAEVGNGGLSIRSKKVMLEIINQKTYRKPYFPEDLYLSQLLKNQNFNIAPFKTASEFSVEEVYNSSPFGCHKCWQDLRTHELKTLLK